MIKKIFITLIILVNIFLLNLYSEDYSYTRLYINTTKSFINKVDYILNKKIAIVLDNEKMYSVVSILSNKFNIPVYVEKGLENRIVSIVSDNIKVLDLLKRIQEESDSFLVYRNGYLLFAKRLEAVFTLNAPIAKNYLIKLVKNIVNTDSVLYIDGNKIVSKLDIKGLNNLRSFLIENNLRTKILSTDAVLPIGPFN